MKVECTAAPGNTPTVVDHVRLFPRHSGLRWEYRVHENILPAINRLGGEVAWTDVVIRHTGYLDPAHRERKRKRDHALLLRNIDECPEDPFVHFNLGHSYFDMGELDRAAHHLKGSIARSEPHYSQVKKAYALLAQVEHGRGDVAGALRVLEEGRRHHPDNPELLFFAGLTFQELGKLAEARTCFGRILETKTWPKEFGSFDTGILGQKSKHQLALLEADAGDATKAVALLSEIVEEHPEYFPARKDLVRIFITAGRKDEAEAHLARLGGRDGDAAYLAGLLHVHGGRFEEAAQRFGEALSIDPKNEEALSELAHVHLRLGHVDAAQEALRAHVRLNPRSPHAHYNLAGVCAQRNCLSEAQTAIEKAALLRPNHEATEALRAEIARRLSAAGGYACGPESQVTEAR
jgi:tetratricopeptide (TPR) repeat protein